MNRQITSRMLAIAVAVGVGLIGGRAGGEPYYYDNDGTNAGFGTAGGAWAAPTPGPIPGWTTDGTGAADPASVTTTTGDILNFGNGATGLTGGIITVSGTVDAGNMTFASGSGAIVLSGGTITLATNATITVSNAYDTIDCMLTGAGGSLTKAGTGALTLTGSNVYSGTTVISGGILAISNASALGNIAGNTTIAASGASTGPRLAISGNINSPENITLTGNTEQSNYAGVIFNTSGTNILSGNITLANPAGNIRLLSGEGELIFAGAISQTTSTRTLLFQAGSGAAITVSNAIANNSGALYILGYATGGASAGVTLNAASTAIGNVTVQENGLLRLGVTDAIKTTSSLTLGAATSWAGNGGFDFGAFDLAGFNQTINALIGTKNTGFTIGADSNRKVTNSGAGTGTNTLTVGNGNGSGTFNGVILDGATAKVALTKTGSGDLTLPGVNTYTGNTTINNGRIVVATATGVPSGSAVSQSGTGQLFVTGTGLNIANSFTISTVGYVEGGDPTSVDGAIRSDGAANTFSGTITLAGNSRFGSYGNAKVTTIRGKITGGYAMSFYGLNGANNDTQTFILSNTANDYTGDTQIDNKDYQAAKTGNSTTLKLGASNVIPDGASAGNVVLNGVSVNELTVLDLNGFSETINGLTVGGAAAGARIQNATTGASVLTIGSYDTTSSFSGTITDSGVGKTLAITKTGAGTLTLSGANTYSGGTAVSNGVLLVNGSLFTNAVTVAGGTLGGTGTVNGAVSVLPGGAIAPGASLGVFNAASNVTLAAGGTLAIEIDDAQTPACDMLAVSGALNITGATSAFTVAGGPTGTVYVIATYPAGRLTGTFGATNGLPFGYTVDYAYNSGTAIALLIDTNAPSPDPMTFAAPPEPLNATRVVMTATTATDDTGPVEYFFENTTNTDSSGWILDTVWTNTGLTTGTTYGYRVKARDARLQETEFSDIVNATPVVDVTPPTLSTLSPANNAVDVLVSNHLAATFGEYVFPANGGVITLTNLTAGTAVTMTIPDSQVATAGRVLTINPTADLQYGATYAVLIATNAVEDFSANAFAGITDATTWRFTADKPPEILSLSPTNDATGVEPAANLTATFDEDVSIVGGGVITIKNLTRGTSTNLTIPNAQVSVLGAVLTINPTEELRVSNRYAIQIGATALRDGQGTAFAGIADDVTWTFTIRDAITTTYIGPSDNSDNWNNAAYWDHGVPSGQMNAVISAGRLATVNNAATPVYTEQLTISTGATVGIGYLGTLVENFRALGTAGSTTIFMHNGSFINCRPGGTPAIPAIQLLGNAEYRMSSSTQPSSSPTFGHGINGAYRFTLSGKGGCNAYLTTSNSFSELAADPITGTGWYIYANAAGSLGNGVTLRQLSGVVAANLIVNAADAMADTGTLNLNGTSATLVTMNANDTIRRLIVNGLTQPYGTYGRVGNAGVEYPVSWLAGNGILTVPQPPTGYWDLNDTADGAGGPTPDGLWDATNMYWNSAAAGTNVAVAWTPGHAVAFAAGTDAGGTYTVTVDGMQDMGGLLTFEEGEVTLLGGELRMTADTAANVASGLTATVASVITNDAMAWQLSKGSAGTLVLSGSNTYAGVTKVEAGTLSVASLANAGAVSPIGAYPAAGAGGLVLAGGGAFQYTGGPLSVNRGFTLNGNGTLDISAAGVTLTLGASQCADLPGTLTVSGGAGSTLAVGALTLVEGLSMTLNPTTASLTVASAKSSTHYPLAGPTLTLGGTAAGNVITGSLTVDPFQYAPAMNVVKSGSGAWTISGGVNAGGTLTVNGGTLTLSGASSYGGATTVNGGTLIAGANAPSGANGAFGNSTAEISLGVAGGSTDASILIGGAFGIGRSIRLPTSNTTDVGTRTLTLGGSTATNSTFSGAVHLGTANQAGRDVTLTAAEGGQVTFSGAIQNPAGMDPSTNTVTKTGLGTVVFSGVNTYTGDTRVEAGTLSLAGSGTLADGASLRVAGGATIHLSEGVNETVARLYLNELPMYRGTWGGPSSTAEHRSEAIFSGTGILTVSEGGIGSGVMLIVR